MSEHQCPHSQGSGPLFPRLLGPCGLARGSERSRDQPKATQHVPEVASDCSSLHSEPRTLATARLQGRKTLSPGSRGCCGHGPARPASCFHAPRRTALKSAHVTTQVQEGQRLIAACLSILVCDWSLRVSVHTQTAKPAAGLPSTHHVQWGESSLPARFSRANTC